MISMFLCLKCKTHNTKEVKRQDIKPREKKREEEKTGYIERNNEVCVYVCTEMDGTITITEISSQPF